MPLYFFHLSFGERIVPDDEGIELPNRSAAREEALAAVRDLKVGRNPRRWAGWFLQVADEGGQFLRLPLGHPALEIVARDTQLNQGRPTASVAARQGVASGGRFAALVQQRTAVRERTAQLLERNRELRGEFSSLYLVSENIRVRASRLVSRARFVK
jgi:hypothetical protein